jgi:hypothetical protein
MFMTILRPSYVHCMKMIVFLINLNVHGVEMTSKLMKEISLFYLLCLKEQRWKTMDLIS